MTSVRTALLLSLALAGCRRPVGSGPQAKPGADGAGAPELPTVRVEPDGGPYLFSYYGQDGKLHDVDKVADVPAESRRQVLIRDLSRSPKDLKTDEYLYLADLRTAPPDDGYPTSIVSRYQFEAAGDVVVDASVGDDGGSSQVIVYGTSWCGACKAARSHLRERHIPFVEKDIEQDSAAAQELARKAKRVGLKLGGVPVIDVLGQLMMGYDPNSLDRAWAQAHR